MPRDSRFVLLAALMSGVLSACRPSPSPPPPPRDAGEPVATSPAAALPSAADAADAKRFLSELRGRLDQEHARAKLECDGIFVPEGLRLSGNYIPEGISSYEPCTYPSADERERLRKVVKKHEHETVSRFERAHHDAKVEAPKHHVTVPEPIDLWAFSCQTPRGVAIHWHWMIEGPYRPHFNEGAGETFPFVKNDLERLYLVNGDTVKVLDPGGRGSIFPLGTVDLDGDGAAEIVWVQSRSNEPRSHATSQTLNIAWSGAPVPLPEAIRGERWDGNFKLLREGDAKIIRLGDGPPHAEEPSFTVREGRFVPWKSAPDKSAPTTGACATVERKHAARGTLVGFAEYGAGVEACAGDLTPCGPLPERVRRLYEALLQADLPPQEARRWVAKLFQLDERTLPGVPAPSDEGKNH
ncbi:hypothetical protein [Polyangium jinanense]|uniref:FG-GAP repeat protein n=1 Tax=Polyangium jinanense TaxID=2829994 RepID=A0A9X3XEW4_9BACT|nr:hypothetical protein [Polyangium jinanense]MDC3962006.1 hypothetical protein [Polyangium jinanense]MDC3988902.1 hypothetical protein [Polyangium jinanense]